MSRVPYAQLKAEHKCTSCKRQDERTLAGKSLCDRCRRKKLERSQKRRQEAKDAWACQYCKEQDERTRSGESYCKKCKDFFSQKYYSIVAEDLCPLCKKREPEPGYTVCGVCREKCRLNSAARRAKLRESKAG